MRALLAKELRALLPLWFVAVGGALAGASAPAMGAVASQALWSWGFPLMVLRDGLDVVGNSAFVIGSVALGAWAFGHEHAHRTLPALLAQPVSRGRLLLAKFVVLAGLLAALAAMAVSIWAGDWSLDPPFPRYPGPPTIQPFPMVSMLVLAPLLGLCVAPALTLLCRGAMAGAVLSLAVPAVLWLGAEIVRVRRYGVVGVPDEASLGGTLLWAGTLAVSLVALVAAPYRFRRLEAIDAPRELAVRRRLGWVRAGAPVLAFRRRHPVVALLAKEIRLQWVTFLLPAMYVLAWAGIVLAGVGDQVLGATFFGMTTIYALVTATMLGAVASAEERAHGTLDAQLLQPMSFRWQWLVKVAVVLALVAGLTMALPELLERLYVLNDQPTLNWRTAATFVLCAAAGLYVSSISASPLRALLFSGGFLVLSLMLVSLAEGLGYGLSRAVVPQEILDFSVRHPLLTRDDLRIETEIWAGLRELVWWIGLLGMLWLAAGNHRSVDGVRARWRRQLWLPAVVGTAALASTAVPALARWYLATH